MLSMPISNANAAGVARDRERSLQPTVHLGRTVRPSANIAGFSQEFIRCGRRGSKKAAAADDGFDGGAGCKEGRVNGLLQRRDRDAIETHLGAYS